MASTRPKDNHYPTPATVSDRQDSDIRLSVENRATVVRSYGGGATVRHRRRDKRGRRRWGVVDLVLAAAVGLLVAGVLVSIVPGVPGAVFTLAGLLFYWWQTGEPGTVALVVLVLLALTAIVLDYLAGVVSARAGGASWKATIIATVIGLVLTFVLGPLGFLFGTGGVVFVAEFVRHGDFEKSRKAAVYTTAGIVVSTFVRVVLNIIVLVLFLVLVLL